jgi:hypothetical protein
MTEKCHVNLKNKCQKCRKNNNKKLKLERQNNEIQIVLCGQIKSVLYFILKMKSFVNIF